MPYVNVKLVKQQVTPVQKEQFIAGLMDILANIMGRDPNFTVIVLDEIDQANWFIAGKPVLNNEHEMLSFVEIRLSKGTSDATQMAEVIKAGKELTKRVLGTSDKTNYFIINELNPDGWGFGGQTMTYLNSLEEN